MSTNLQLFIQLRHEDHLSSRRDFHQVVEERRAAAEVGEGGARGRVAVDAVGGVAVPPDAQTTTTPGLTVSPMTAFARSCRGR